MSVVEDDMRAGKKGEEEERKKEGREMMWDVGLTILAYSRTYLFWRHTGCGIVQRLDLFQHRLH